jgi:hypothetical protein
MPEKEADNDEQEIECTPEYPTGTLVEPFDIAREEELLLNEEYDSNQNKK